MLTYSFCGHLETVGTKHLEISKGLCCKYCWHKKSIEQPFLWSYLWLSHVAGQFGMCEHPMLRWGRTSAKKDQHHPCGHMTSKWHRTDVNAMSVRLYYIMCLLGLCFITGHKLFRACTPFLRCFVFTFLRREVTFMTTLFWTTRLFPKWGLF